MTLSALEYLHTVRLELWPEHYDEQHLYVPTSHLYQHLSFTSDVMLALRPLRSFHIRHMTSKISSDFLTTAMLQALSSHEKSLSELSISSDYPVENTVLQEVLIVVSSFDLATMRVSFGSVSKDYRNLKLESHIAETVKHCFVWLRLTEDSHVTEMKYKFWR